jgi:hypothetical protein
MGVPSSPLHPFMGVPSSPLTELCFFTNLLSNTLTRGPHRLILPQPYPASPRRAPEEYLAESVGGWGDLDVDVGRGGWKDNGQQGEGYEDSRSLREGYDVPSSQPQVQRGEDALGAGGEGGGNQLQECALPYSTVPAPKGLQVLMTSSNPLSLPFPALGPSNPK